MVLQGNALERGALHGPTVREVRPRDKKLVGNRWVRESDGQQYLYTHLKNIGVGGQGQCDLYRRIGQTNRVVVCKVMKRGFELAYNRRGEKEPAEAIILKEILAPHPLIINLQDFDTHTFWLEYCNLGDLQDLCDGYLNHRAKVPESFLWHAYRQIAEAFAFIHHGYTTDPSIYVPNFQTIVHRDVKPSNIFVRASRYRGEYPDLVLADFGIAITTTSLQRENGYLIGTPLYQPPEVPWHSPAGDIWSAGACLHVLATGSPPIRSTPKGWDSKKWYQTPEARAVADLRSMGYSHNLQAALMWTLRKRPEDRLLGKELIRYVSRGEREYLDKKVRRVALGDWVGKK
ncbi:MAG: hypothetical protein Q9213_003204 [Squamulea squamosa]